MNSKWPLVKLGELIKLSREPAEMNPLLPYKQITVKLHHRGVVTREEKHAAEIKSKQYWVRSGQFIISRIDARNGAMGIIPPELDGTIATNDFLTYDVNENRIVPQYLDNLTNMKAFVGQCVRASEGTTNRVRLKPDRLLEIEILLPPLEDQRRIVATIENLKANIEVMKTCRQQTKQETELLFICAFRHAFSPPSCDTWDYLPVEECCEAIIDYRGRTPPMADGGIPHITSANIRNGVIDWKTSKFVSDETYASYMTRGIPRKGDVVLTMEAPLGEAAVVPDNRQFSLAQRTLLLRAKLELMNGDFLARALTSPSVREEILSKATATTVRGIASKHLKAVVLPVPPRDEQRHIVAYLDLLQAEVDELEELQAEIEEEIEELAPSILDNAFKGAL